MLQKTQRIAWVRILQSDFHGILFFHILENIGMTIGLLPITGVPLPFISYGGSSMITNMMEIGLILNVSYHKNTSIFNN